MSINANNTLALTPYELRQLSTEEILDAVPLDDSPDLSFFGDLDGAPPSPTTIKELNKTRPDSIQTPSQESAPTQFEAAKPEQLPSKNITQVLAAALKDQPKSNLRKGPDTGLGK